MAATNINRVVLTGNLTADPELRSLPSGTSVCKLRVACNTRRKDHERRVGRQAQLLRRHRLGRAGRELRPLPLQGPPGRHRRPPRVARVEDKDGNKRQAVDIIADSVQFLGGRDDAAPAPSNGFSAQSDVPVDTNDFAAAPAGGGGGGAAGHRRRRHPVLEARRGYVRANPALPGPRPPHGAGALLVATMSVRAPAGARSHV